MTDNPHEPRGEVSRLALPAGTEMHGYRLEAILGKGGFGLTYLAIDVSLGMKVAIKELLPDGVATRVDGSTVVAQTQSLEETYHWAVQRFEEEARILASLNHPNVVRVLRFFEANGTVYLVMEYVEGTSLKQKILRDGPMDETAARAVLESLMSGLEYLHSKGLLHRDIKPDNVFLRADGTPVLLDFGSARQELGRSVSMTAIVSAGYSPFEQYQTRGKQGAWTDIYALAATISFVMTGQTPPTATDRLEEDDETAWRQTLRGRYSMAFLDAVAAGFRPGLANRPQTVAEWRSILANGRPPAAPPRPDDATRKKPSLEPPPPPGPRRSLHPLILIGGSCAATLAVGALALFVFWPKKSPEAPATATTAKTKPTATPLAVASTDTPAIPTPKPGSFFDLSASTPTPTPAPQATPSPASPVAEATPRDPLANGALEAQMAEKYEKGLGVPQDLAKAEELYRKAAEAGNVTAQTWLGAKLIGKSKNAEALKWLTLAAEAGDPEGQLHLGTLYTQGRGVPTDHKESFRWTKLSAINGYVPAYASLGVNYCFGIGVEKDEKIAAEWFRKGAEAGDDLGIYYYGQSLVEGRGVPKDVTSGLMWLRKGADRGSELSEDALKKYAALAAATPVPTPDITIKDHSDKTSLEMSWPRLAGKWTTKVPGLGQVELVTNRVGDAATATFKSATYGISPPLTLRKVDPGYGASKFYFTPEDGKYIVKKFKLRTIRFTPFDDNGLLEFFAEDGTLLERANIIRNVEM